MRLDEAFTIVDGRLDIRQSPLAHPPPDCKNIVDALESQEAISPSSYIGCTNIPQPASFRCPEARSPNRHHLGPHDALSRGGITTQVLADRSGRLHAKA